MLKEYVRRTKDVRGSETKLLLSHQKPHKHVSKDTLARCMRDVLSEACGDRQQFGAHSTHAANTSAAATCGVPVDVLLRAAGWSAEYRIHVFTFLQEDASCKYGTGPVGFLRSQEINK